MGTHFYTTLPKGYAITERLEAAVPTLFDPLARAMKCHSGMFDLRDPEANNVICASGMNLKALRAMQARLNTARGLSALGL